MDSAIGEIKRACRRIQEIKGGTWLDHLQTVANAYNTLPMEALETLQTT